MSLIHYLFFSFFIIGLFLSTFFCYWFFFNFFFRNRFFCFLLWKTTKNHANSYEEKTPIRPNSVSSLNSRADFVFCCVFFKNVKMWFKNDGSANLTTERSPNDRLSRLNGSAWLGPHMVSVVWPCLCLAVRRISDCLALPVPPCMLSWAGLISSHDPVVLRLTKQIEQLQMCSSTPEFRKFHWIRDDMSCFLWMLLQHVCLLL